MLAYGGLKKDSSKGGRIMRRSSTVGGTAGRLAAVLVMAAGVLTAAAADNAQSPMGVNFWFFWDNQSVWPFVDFFKQSRALWSCSESKWDDGRALALRPDGYPAKLEPGQSAATLVFWDQQTAVPRGDYTLLWDGDGDVSADLLGEGNAAAGGGTNRVVVTLKEGVDPRLRIKITRTSEADPVRNIRFIAPGFETNYAQQVFHPTFLKTLAPFRVLRFMDWMHANNNDIVHFDQRSTPQSQTQNHSFGICVEHLVDLCNRLDADGWFCLPVKASDDYYRQYATYVRDHLKPGLKAYFEYGNEMWNGGVQRGVAHVEGLGVAMGHAKGWTAQHHGWAKRMTEMLIVVEQVYGAQSNRCVRVAATQCGNTGVADGILSFYDGAKHADVLAVAPYFNPAGANQSLDQVIAALDAQAGKVGEWIKGDLAIAQRHGLDLVCYESGLDVWGLNDDLKKAVRFDPRMKAIYRKYLDGWKQGGGTLIVQYTFCDPYWGLMREQDDARAEAPMYDAALEWIEANPRWWDKPPAAPKATNEDPGG
jgi:hypothetical protein